MTRTAEELLSLLHTAVFGAPLPEGFSVEDEGALFRLAVRQDLAHLGRAALPTLGEAWEEQRLRAIFRVGVLSHAHAAAAACLSRAGIAHLPLKGAYLRTLFPAPWMRTSCDLDLLVNREDATRAAACLCRELGYILKAEEHNDLSLYSADGTVHLELHFSLDALLPDADGVLARAWEYAVPDGQGGTMLDPAFHLFYLVAHLASHLLSGGGGIRPVLDIFLLHRAPHDAALFHSLCEEGGLARFAAAVVRLGEVLFADGEGDSVTDRLGAHLLEGPLYADTARRAALLRAREASADARRRGRAARRAYLWRRLLPPLSQMAALYPVLSRHPWLLPVCHVRRWFRLLLGGRLALALRRARAAADVTSEELQEAGELLRLLDL